jgi:hypothetical protein
MLQLDADAAPAPGVVMPGWQGRQRCASAAS